MLAPLVGVAVAVMVAPAGEVTDAIVEPDAGEVMEIVGVANAAVTEAAKIATAALEQNHAIKVERLDLKPLNVPPSPSKRVGVNSLHRSLASLRRAERSLNPSFR
jgi:hypothetical protein